MVNQNANSRPACQNQLQPAHRGLLSSGWLVCLTLSFLCCGIIRPVLAEEAQGSSSRTDRSAAQRAIPYDQLEAHAKQKVSDILANVTIFRRLPTEKLQCDPELYLFLINRPDAVVNIWEVLGISDVALRQTGRNSYRADDGNGTLADVEFLYRNHDCHLILASGSYRGPLFNRQVRGKCLMLLRSNYQQGDDGRFSITHRLDVFCQLENAGAGLLAKTFQPFVSKVADRNFVEISDFVSTLFRKVERDIAWSQEIASRMENVHPSVREGFLKLSMRIAAQNALQQSSLPPAATSQVVHLDTSAPIPLEAAPLEADWEHCGGDEDCSSFFEACD